MRVHSDEQPRSATLTLRDKGFHWEAAIFFVGFLLAFGGKNHDEKKRGSQWKPLAVGLALLDGMCFIGRFALLITIF